MTALENPPTFSGGIALARMLRKLKKQDLIVNDGLLVGPTRRALYLWRSIGALAFDPQRSAI
ncbi:MAG TPA: hypothetical protein VG448_01650 [Solirubrobacterales bacterium]|nr:hypothetical protein [Solirubrobacterales bacterium]